MILPQGDLALLDTELAQTLLRSVIPARLAYSWTDGSARVVPIYFSWTGQEVVMGTPPTSPKIKALTADPRVAITIDTEGFPAQVLMLRGIAAIQIQEGVVAEYGAAVRRYWGEDAGNAWVADLESQPRMTMAALASVQHGQRCSTSRLACPVPSADWSPPTELGRRGRSLCHFRRRPGASSNAERSRPGS